MEKKPISQLQEFDPAAILPLLQRTAAVIRTGPGMRIIIPQSDTSTSLFINTLIKK